MFKNWDWEDAWLSLLWIVAGTSFCAFIFFIVSKKPTTRYSLGENNNHLTIVREIEWFDDDRIELDRSVSYWEAIRMVDSLNKTLK